MVEASAEHARLEVAILRSESGPLEAEGDVGNPKASGGRTVLVLAAEPEVRAYIRSCLNGLQGVHVVESQGGNRANGEELGQSAHLVVVEAPDAHTATVLLSAASAFQVDALPRVLILDERPLGVVQHPNEPVIILSKPFNAQRLVNAATVLLG